MLADATHFAEFAMRSQQVPSPICTIRAHVTPAQKIFGRGLQVSNPTLSYGLGIGSGWFLAHEAGSRGASVLRNSGVQEISLRRVNVSSISPKRTRFFSMVRPAGVYNEVTQGLTWGIAPSRFSLFKRSRQRSALRVAHDETAAWR